MKLGKKDLISPLIPEDVNFRICKAEFNYK